YYPEKVVINGKEYDVTKKENQYTVLIDGIQETGEKEIIIEEVTLSNGREFTLQSDNKTTVRIMKQKPTVEDFTSEENIEQNNIKVAFNLKDEDKAIKTANIILLDEEEKQISNQELSAEEIQQAGKIEKILTTKVTSKYKIKVIATYNQTGIDTEDVVDSILFEQEVEANPRTIIKQVTHNKDYIEKNGNVTITYDIETNKTEEITKITVNNTDYQVTKLENGKFEIVVTLDNRSGVQELTTTKVFYSDNTSTDAHNTIKVEILKDKPSIQNFKQQDNEGASEVTLEFDLIDQDSSFMNAKAVFTKKEDNTIEEKEVTVGKNSITFNVENAKLYTLEIKVSYDRDTNTLENKPQEDNRIADETMLTKEIQLLSDYELQISNIKTYKELSESKYFGKNENIIVKFESTNVSNFVPEKVVINQKEYNLTKTDNTYQVTIDTYTESGIKDIVIEKIILDNTKEIQLTQNNQVKIEILKDEPKVIDFGYTQADDNTITVTFNIDDKEDTIASGNIIITDEAQKTVATKEIKKGENTITFTKNGSEVYTAKVIANYDLDTNNLETGKNEYTDQEIHSENIYEKLERRFEMKDITNIKVYQSSGEKIIEKQSLRETDLVNLDSYIVKVEMKNMPSFYSTISEYKIEDEKLNLVLNNNNIIQYVGDKKRDKLMVTYGALHDGVAEKDDLAALINKIKENPSGTFNLTKDYYALDVGSNASLIDLGDVAFTGTINGNGHKLYTLNKPLFNNIEGATIKDLILEDVTLASKTSKGSIANTATNANLKNVHIKNFNLTTKANEIGGFIGNLIGGTIEECSVTNSRVTTSGHIRIGGIVGYMNGGTIRNCYVQGEVNSTQNKDGNGIGGILGHGLEAPITIENCITKINYTWTGGGPRLNGAIVGLTMNSSGILKNNVSLSTGTGINKVYGLAINRSSTNNYELEESELTSNATEEVVKTISKNNISKEFFKESANFDENIWDLEGASYEQLPKLKGNNQQEDEGENNAEEVKNNLYIPEYNRIKQMPEFNTEKLVSYHNIQKLMPYYDSQYLVIDSANISNTHVLNTKTIKHILPFANNKLVTYLTSKDYEKITSIKVIFTDNTIEEYEVNFENLIESVAIYKIPELNINYAFGNYILNGDSEVINKLTDYIKSVDYNTVLEPLTEAADSRLYRDNYNNVIKNMAEEIVLGILQNEENSILMLDNEILNQKIEQELIGTEKMNKMIYAYNYYQRWYGFEIGGAKISDIILFEGNMYSDTMTLYNVVNEVFIGNLNPGNTDNFYNNCLKKYTGSSSIGYFLDGIITKIGQYENIDDWFTEYFGDRNVLSEVSVDHRPEVLYRAWYQLKKNPRMVLPVITLPAHSGYMISGPAHLQFGPQQLYHKDPDTTAGRAEVVKKVNTHVNLVKRHFSTLADSFNYKKWNNYCIMVYDCTRAITSYKNTYIPGTNIIIGTSPVYTQGKVGQEQPFFKNFSEVFGLWQPAGSSAGVANTAGYLWFQATPGLTNYDTWTHEFEHALYDKIMLDQRGCRVQLETLTQGNVEQRVNWSENNLVQDVGPYYFNTSFYLNKEGNATQNLTPERINTKEKLENYYKGQQNALDLLDYIEGKAFIKLTPEQQAKIATRMSISAGWSSWGTITTEQATQMNLTSLEALYDNRIMLRPNNAWGVSVRGLNVINGIGSNDYGYESVWVNRWFIGHLDGGYADALSTKRNFFEMLGYAGVEGYITYGSRASANDLDAIKKITKMVTGTEMDWKQYKMSRYATIEENLDNKYIDIEFMIEKFTEALINDANKADRNISQRTALRKVYYHYLKSATNDFIGDPLGTDIEITHIKTAQELVEKINEKPYGYYILDNDIDFSKMTTNVTKTFMGKLEGNGHKIIGNTIPIFQKIRYGSVANLVIEGTNIPTNLENVGALAAKTEYSVLDNIQAKEIKMNFGGRNEINLIAGAISTVTYRDCKADALKVKISTVEDINKLKQDPGGIFVIEKDLDMRGYTATTNAVVTGIFTGKIEGNGHTISNLTDISLFENFRGTVENLNISNFSNTGAGRGNGDFVTAFAQETFTATFKNMKFENITLSGRNNVAVVTGMDGRDNANSVFENISVKNANITGTGVYVSTFAGRKYGGKMKDIYVQGTLNVTSTENGGLVGSMQQGGTIENVITDVAITKTSNTYTNVANSIFNASLVGNIYNTPSIKNSIAFGDMTGYTDTTGNEMLPYKFTGAAEAQVKACLSNCYEVTEEIGSSRVNANTAGHLNTIARQNLNEAFYRGLGFDESIWDFTKINVKGYPQLK
ncbi:MAG: hypothetical protein HFJ53_07830, partial [Clostridia bacterium]|nr:hypothetical protein [Clostridia bacterium]